MNENDFDIIKYKSIVDKLIKVYLKEHEPHITKDDYSIEISYYIDPLEYKLSMVNEWAGWLSIEEIEEITDVHVTEYLVSKQIDVDEFDEKTLKGEIVFAGIDEDDYLTFKIKFI